MKEYLCDGSTIKYSKEQLEDYKQNNLLYMQIRIQILEQALNDIEEYLDAQQKYFDGEDYHNLLDIIDKTKERKCT